MQLTRQGDYAARAVIYLAKHQLANIKEVATEQQVPQEYLAKIVQKLVAAGIISSQRGKGGGISLAKPPENISLLEVIEAVEGPVVLNRCLIRPNECPRDAFCSIHGELAKIQHSLRKQLGALDFAKLAKKEKGYK